MDTKKIKEGVSVKEIEGFAKKYRFEVFFCLALVLSWVFSFVFFAGWSLLFTTIGGLLTLLFSATGERLLKKIMVFFRKQEDITQLILGIAGLILAVFLPFVVFLFLGACAGVMFKQITAPVQTEEKPKV